jgi:hypothetical protein
MRVIAALLFAFVACQTPSQKAALPDAKPPKDVAISYIDLLRQNHCDAALAYVNGRLKITYQKMIEGKGFLVACEAWRAQYLPYEVIEFSHEEELSKSRKKIWLRLYKDKGGVSDVFSIEVESQDDRWWVVAV